MSFYFILSDTKIYKLINCSLTVFFAVIFNSIAYLGFSIKWSSSTNPNFEVAHISTPPHTIKHIGYK